MPADYYDDGLQVLENRGRVDSVGGLGLGLGKKPKKKKPKQDSVTTSTLAQKAVERKNLGGMGELPGPLGTSLLNRQSPVPSLKDKQGMRRRSPI